MVDPTVVDVLPYGWRFISAESSSSSYDISGLSTDTVDDVTKVTIPVKVRLLLGSLCAFACWWRLTL